MIVDEKELTIEFTFHCVTYTFVHSVLFKDEVRRQTDNFFYSPEAKQQIEDR
jgi:hypothetical protein